MAFTRQYIKFLKPEVRVSRGEIKPRNIYRISTYKGGEPATKTGDQTRYVFVIGKVDNKIHCIKMNDIKPLEFTKFINKLRDKRIPIKSDQALAELLKKFSKDGKQLFETYVRNNSQVYSSKLGNYRTYLLENIINVWEIRFEDGFLRELFGEPNNPNTVSNQRVVIKDEIIDDDE